MLIERVGGTKKWQVQRRMNLFDKINVAHEESPDHEEPHFHYLNHSTRPEAERVRVLVNGWFARYPSDSQDDLKARFRSNNNNTHVSAFFELYLHELLWVLDYKIQVHPSLINTTRKPDFLATDPAGNSFYLEAIAITGETDRQASERAQIHRLYDVVNRKLITDKYFIGLHIRRRGMKAPKASGLVTFLGRHLQKLDFESLASAKEGWRSNRWTWQSHGWKIECFATARSTEYQNEPPSRALGFTSGGVYKSVVHEQIRRAVIKKASRYGKPAKPYIIAVNVFEEHADTRAFIDALFGDDQYTVEVTSAGPGASYQNRNKNGVWTSDKAPRYTQYTRVSGVLALIRLEPWRVAHANWYFYHNPLASHPYTGTLDRLPNYKMGKKHYQLTEGLHPREVFNLLERWPE